MAEGQKYDEEWSDEVMSTAKAGIGDIVIWVTVGDQHVTGRVVALARGGTGWWLLRCDQWGGAQDEYATLLYADKVISQRKLSSAGSEDEVPTA